MHLDLGPSIRTLRRHPMVLLLMVLEVAAGVAAISSLLMSGSWYAHVAERPSGLDEENLILVSTYTPGVYAPERDDAAVERSVREQQAADRRRAGALPGVEAAVQVTTTILDDRWNYPTVLEARRAGGAPAGRSPGWVIYADAGLMAAMRLKIVAGAAPTAVLTGAGTGAGDRPAGVLVTRSLAVSLFGSAAAALGGTILPQQTAATRVTAVVEDVRMRIPFMPKGSHVAFVFGEPPFDHEARLLVRAEAGQRDAVLARVKAAFAPNAARRFVEVRPFDSHVSLHHRIGSGLWRLLKVFGVMLGGVVLLGALAATSFLVAQRTRQIGIRRALGATRADIVGYFLLESTLATTFGSLLGVGGTLLLHRLMKRVFLGIGFDLGLLGLTLVLLWMASVLATLIPALRAARVPPSVASRSL